MFLIINTGSTSVKIAVYNDQNILVFSNKITLEVLQLELTKLGREYQITVCIHRIVHGGSRFSEPVVVTQEVLKELKALSDIAPLHNPPALLALDTCIAVFPDAKMIAVFDTAFHATIPLSRQVYGLPYEAYKLYGIKRYGFHGISHQWISRVVSRIAPQANRIISCHLGGGCSVCAILNNESVYCSMGYSPDEGTLMATRSGDVGVGALLAYKQALGLDDVQMLTVINTQSGILGLSRFSANLKEVVESDTSNARLAVDIFIESVVNHIGSAVVAAGGIDAVVFTGGVGEGSSVVRQKILDRLVFLGLEVDTRSNTIPEHKTVVTKISSSTSKVPVWVIPASESQMMLDLATNLI